VDLSTLKATGNGGRIRERDVLAVALALPEEALPNDPVSMCDLPVTSLAPSRADDEQRAEYRARNAHLPGRRDEHGGLAETIQIYSGDSLVPAYIDIVAKLVAVAFAKPPGARRSMGGRTHCLAKAIHIGIASTPSMACSSRWSAMC